MFISQDLEVWVLCEPGQSRTNPGCSLLGICSGKFLLSGLWRSGAHMGVSWAGWRLLLLGSGSGRQILLSACFLKAQHDVPDSRAVA